MQTAVRHVALPVVTLSRSAPRNASITSLATWSLQGRKASTVRHQRSMGASGLALRPRRANLVARAEGDGSGDNGDVKYNTEFGYSRKDIIIIGVGLIAGGFVLYYGLQAGGMDAGMAGNWVQLIIFLGICIGWIGSYLYRVATKQMTYVKQLEDYEDAVMAKRLEEMPEVEIEAMMEDIEVERERRNRRKGGNAGPGAK